MNQMINIHYWDSDTEEETPMLVELEHVIRNPGGFKIADLGLEFLNAEREKRGLTKFKENTETGTYDEVPREN